ncbi:MAG: hypothetical protein EOO75_08215 [Myxococcales bacterium]|nr:MAG: hypothetical protein EOO75_08215 [Myxococcales bacterium]
MGLVPEMLLMLIPAAYTALYVASSRGVIEREMAVHELRRTRRGTVREMVDGEPVRLVGRVEVDEGTSLLEAPLSGRPCVAFRALTSESEGRSIGQILIDDHGALPFWVRDATGRVLVPAARVVPWVKLDTIHRGGLLRRTPDRIRAYLERHAGGHQGLLPGNPGAFAEGIVAPGDLVAVAGHGRFDPRLGAANESGYRERVGTPVLDPLRDGFVLVSNLARVM